MTEPYDASKGTGAEFECRFTEGEAFSQREVQIELAGNAQNVQASVSDVLSPSCIWCERNRKNIDELTKAKGKDSRFVGLSLSGEQLKEYVEEHHLNFPVYTGLKSDAIQALGLGGTPQTIVISPEGLVLKNWPGAYREQTQREVEDYFQVRLPGLVSADH